MLDSRQMLNQPHIETALIEVTDTIDNFTGESPPCRIFFKNESEQPSGSFKLRGLGNMIQKRLEEAKSLGKNDIKVFSSSGGNAGLAAAYAAKVYGLDCVVVLPQGTSKNAIKLLKDLSAEVLVKGAHWGEADKFLNVDLIGGLEESVYPIYCHPFDHEYIWDGHATMVDEITHQLAAEDLKEVKGVVCSVGGGGLYNGIVAGIERSEYDFFRQTPVFAVETRQAPTFHSAIEAGKPVTLTSVKTAASSLASPYISSRALENYENHATTTLLIDDRDAIKGTVDYYTAFKKIVEPACGATLSLAFAKSDLLSQAQKLSPHDIMIFIVCGGKIINEEQLLQLKKTLSENANDAST